MFRCRNFLVGIISLYFLTFTLLSHAEDEIEDLIDIVESGDEIIAIVEGKKTVTYDLKPNETVLWTGYRGEIGSFLTDRHFFVLSTSSSSWQRLPLGIDESENAVASVSPYLALLVTDDRAVAFDATTNHFNEARLSIREDVDTAEVEKYVAVVATSERVFGLASGSSGFREIKLKVHESIMSVNLSANKVTITTSDRLLSFQSRSGNWIERRLN